MPQPLDSHSLLQHLQRLTPDRKSPLRCVVALSGGLDSSVLLHCLAQARKQYPAQLQVRAIHVDHHLQAAAAQFRSFCRRLARRLDVPLTVRDALVRVPRGGSVEEAARIARYEILRTQLRSGELLLTAQHADDQLETLLLALLRGAGPAGLAAMPAVMKFGAGFLLRPLLGTGRATLAAYASAVGLEWIEDPSNRQLRFDRNYLRAAVVPRMRERWPALAQTLARSARHCSEAVGQLERSALHDLDLACDGPDLEVAVLRRWGRARQKSVLRAWIAHRGARVPDERRLDEALRMLDARRDALPLLCWPGARLRRHAGRLILQVAGDAASRQDDTAAPDKSVTAWDWRRPLALPGGSLMVRRDAHGDLDLDRLPARVRVVRLGAAGNRGGRRLRKLMQELQVPAWERGDLPLLYGRGAGRDFGRLLAVGDLWLADALRSDQKTRRRGRIVWRDHVAGIALI